MYKLKYDPPSSVCANAEMVKSLERDSIMRDSYTFQTIDNQQLKMDDTGIIRLKSGIPALFSKYYGTDVDNFKEGRIGLVEKQRNLYLVHQNGILQLQSFQGLPNFAWQILYVNNLVSLFSDGKYVDYDVKTDSFVMANKDTMKLRFLLVKGIKTKMKPLAILNRAQVQNEGESVYRNVDACVFPRESLASLSLSRDTCYANVDIGLRPTIGSIFPIGGCSMRYDQPDKFRDMLMKTSDNLFLTNLTIMQVIETEISNYAAYILELKKSINEKGVELTNVINEQMKYALASKNLVTKNTKDRDILRIMKDNCRNRSFLTNKSRTDLCTDVALDRPPLQYAAFVDNCVNRSSTMSQQWRYDPNSEQIRWMAKDMGSPMCLAISRTPTSIPEDPLAPKPSARIPYRDHRGNLRYTQLPNTQLPNTQLPNTQLPNTQSGYRRSGYRRSPNIPITSPDGVRIDDDDDGVIPGSISEPMLIELKKCENVDSQKWKLNDKEIRSSDNNCLGILGSRPGRPGDNMFVAKCTGKPNQQWEFIKEQPAQFVGDCSIMGGTYNRTFNKSNPYDFQSPGSITFDKGKGTGKAKQGDQDVEFTCIEKNLIKVPDMGNIEGRGDGKTIQWSNGNVWKKEERPVLVYEDCDFQGKFVELLPGAYPNPASIGLSGTRGRTNDIISSIKVPAGRKALLFEDNGYKGKQLEVTEDISCLKDFEFNDATSSMKVT